VVGSKPTLTIRSASLRSAQAPRRRAKVALGRSSAGPALAPMLAHGSRYLRTGSHAGATMRCSATTRRSPLADASQYGRRRFGRAPVGEEANPSEPLASESSLRTWPRAKWTPRGSSREARWCSRVIQEDRSGRDGPSIPRERRSSWQPSGPRFQNGRGAGGSQPKPKATVPETAEGEMTSRGAFGSAHASRHGGGGRVASRLRRTSQGRARDIASLKARAERSPRGEREASIDRSNASVFSPRGIDVPTSGPARGPAQAGR
jgi:hypothetical protein